MSDILTVLSSSPALLLVLMYVIFSFMQLVKEGKIKGIGKYGVKLSSDNDIKKLDYKDAQLEHMSRSLDAYGDSIKQLVDTVTRIEHDVIRLQILSDNVDVFTKIKLYDLYKGKGGNSYIDTYISKLMEEVCSGEED